EDEDVTYAELDRRAGALASELVRRGVGPDVAVAICLERSIELVVALVAVLKAGGAYVPLDPGYPRERLRFMVEDAKPAVILDEEFFRKSLTTDDTDQRRGSKPDLDSSNLAYVIYTSGSTGRPKGAMNTHAGIVNRLRWMQEQYRLTEADCVLQKTPFSFDVSVWEFFWPLITGARLVLAKPGGHQDPNYLAQLIARAKVTTMHFVPSMLQAFLATAELDQCANLRRVICSGEALSYEVQQRFHESLNAELHNLYGPTEASVDVTYWACERDGVRQTVPIGRPIANTQIYILDSNGQPVPAGVAGELMIGGTGLGRGYLNRPDLTADRFQPHPFSTTPGARLYRSGDLARFNADGEIEYLGRLDQQVKVRGFRIELGEIEAALSTHDAVRECVVTANDVTPGDTRLVAYVVSTAEPATSEELRLHLKERLPEYMVPSFFVALEQLPRLPNGKIDRRSLPAPSQPESTREFVAPRNKVETEVANIWSAVLRVERPGVHDNFFELGGHSLLAAQIIA
ncbi:MAG TPA: amino acid adenylation domain-containing protein, partial [Pyrinomonadaceae bacterium]|nr:amino acid adenylation domain-containing protein [Pyrinomonadaceae bacterium]